MLALNSSIPVIRWNVDSGEQPTGHTAAISDPGGRGAAIEVLWSSGLIVNREDFKYLSGPIPTEDDQLLAALFRLDGVKAAERIFGTYSFVVWDSRHSRLIAARDRAGTQGLYYGVDKGVIYLSPSQRAISENLGSGLKFDLLAVTALANAQLPPPDRSFHQAVKEIPAGHVLNCSLQGVTVEPYWRAESAPELRLTSDEDYAEAYRDQLTRVCRQYVQAGRSAITLTSGLDSNSVAASLVIGEALPELTAISYTAPDFTQADEEYLSTRVAEQLGLPLIKIRGDRHWVCSRQEGIATSPESPLMSYFLEVMAEIYRHLSAIGISYIFTGFGGGLLYEGFYPTYLDLLLAGRWGDAIRQFRQHGHGRWRRWPSMIKRHFLGPVLSLYTPHRFQSLVHSCRPGGPSLFVPYLRPQARSRVREMMNSSSPRVRMERPGRAHRLRVLRNWLSPRAADLFRRQAAEYGLQRIQPLTDHRLREFMLGLPADQIYRAGLDKIIVRHAFKDHLPMEVIWKRRKTTPEAIAFHGLRVERDKIWPLLTRMRLAMIDVIDEAALRRHYQDFLDGRHQDARFWHTLTVEDWLRRHFP